MLPKQTALKVLQISMDKINGIINFPKCFLKVHSILTQIHVTTSFSLETVLRNLPTILNTI